MTKRLTLALMDPPYESANSTTALRIISAALKKGVHVNVFAYEGAVCLPLKDQAPHANPVKGKTVEEEEHPTTKAFVASLLEIGKDKPQLTWINCGPEPPVRSRPQITAVAGFRLTALACWGNLSACPAMGR